MRKVFAADLGIWPQMVGLEKVSDAMLSSPDYRARIANYLLLYDQIVVPTGNLQILPILRLLLGEGVFDELIRRKVIVLARYDRWIAYNGNGHGISVIQVHEGEIPRPGRTRLLLSYFTPLDEAIEVALTETRPSSPGGRRTELARLLQDNIVELPTQELVRGIDDESYSDILNSPYLRDFLMLRNAGRTINDLVGLESNQAVFCSPHLAPRPGENLEIRAVLRVAFENFVLALSSHVDADEVTGDKATLNLMRAKGQRIGFNPEGEDAFVKVQEVSGVPDLGAAFASNRLDSKAILELRDSKHCQALRDWFADGDTGATSDQVVARFVDSIGKPSLVDRLPSRALRFASTLGIGAAAGPIAGALASAADSFMLSKWFPGKSPRLFMKEAKQLISRNQPVPAPVGKKYGRNALCHCGSGKKHKRCCGEL